MALKGTKDLEMKELLVTWIVYYSHYTWLQNLDRHYINGSNQLKKANNLTRFDEKIEDMESKDNIPF